MRPPDFGNLTAEFDSSWFVNHKRNHVLVFVHGLFSSAKSSWLYQNSKTKEETFWPDLIAKDRRFANYDIYLGGFHTSLDSADYGFENCAEELFDALGRTDSTGQGGPLAYESIVFVCHSTGGIIVRYMLERFTSYFKNKSVGLVLIASPSYGSRLANSLESLSKFYSHKLGLQLRWGSASLYDLDRRFRDLVSENRIRRLVGIEAVEHHFIMHRRLLPSLAKVVPEESGSRYFGRARVLPDTDHFSCVKPPNQNHPVHQLLVDFCVLYAKDREDEVEISTATTSISHELKNSWSSQKDHVTVTWTSDDDKEWFLLIKVNGANSARTIRELLEIIYMSGLSRDVPGMSYGSDWVLEDSKCQVFAPLTWLGAPKEAIPRLDPTWGKTSLESLQIFSDMHIKVIKGSVLKDLRENICGVACQTHFGEKVLLGSYMLVVHLLDDPQPGTTFRTLSPNESCLPDEIGLIDPSDGRAQGAINTGIVHMSRYGRYNAMVANKVLLEGAWLEKNKMAQWYRD